MAYNLDLAQRIRAALAPEPVTEKRMFGSLCFMVRGKMLVCAGDAALLCRLGPANYAEAITVHGVTPMEMNGRTSKAYVYVPEVLLAGKELDAWIAKALAFNRALTSPPSTG